MTTASSRGPALRGKGLGRRMTGSIGSFVVRRARLVLVVAMLAVVGFGVLGFGAFGKLKTGGFQDPGAGSTTAQTLTDQRFGGSVGVVLLVHAEAGTVDDAPARAAGAEAASRLAAVPGVSNVVSYWQTRNPGLRSKDGKYALILGSTRSDLNLSSSELASLRSHSRQVDVTVGGSAAIGNDITKQVGKSLGIAEGIAVPIILALLVFAFGSVVAALLPLAIGVIAILGTFAELFVLGSVTNVAIYAINLTTALGLALAIDYSLLMVSRFREELGRGQEPAQAVVRSVQTAGRTIVFSGATVVAALAVLLIFPLYFLRSFAYAGIGVVLISMAAAVVVLPALLAVLGRRVNSGRLPWARNREPSTAAPFWGRLAGQAMRRPALIAIPVLAVLMLVALPLRHVQFGTPDDRVLPATTQSRAVGDVLREDFTGNSATALNVVTDGPLDRAALTAYATRLSDLAGVARVETSVATFVHGKAVPNSANPTLARPTAQRLSVVSAADPRSNAAKDLVRTVRDLPGPDGVRVYVGGQTAELIDTTHAIGTRLPLAGTAHRAHHVHRAVPVHRVRGAADPLPRAQRRHPRRDRRADGVDLPGGAPVRAAALHRAAAGHQHAGAAVLHRLRPVHGLRGHRAQPHQGAARPGPRQPHRGHRRADPQRTHRHHRRSADRGDLLRLRHRDSQLPAAIRHRRRVRGDHRRDARTRRTGAGLPADTRPCRVVRARTAAPATDPHRPDRSPRLTHLGPHRH